MRRVLREERLDREVERKEAAMHGWISGSDWIWMTLMMGLWLVLLGAVVYVAVRLAQRPPAGPKA